MKGTFTMYICHKRYSGLQNKYVIILDLSGVVTKAVTINVIKERIRNFFLRRYTFELVVSRRLVFGILIKIFSVMCNNIHLRLTTQFILFILEEENKNLCLYRTGKCRIITLFVMNLNSIN